MTTSFKDLADALVITLDMLRRYAEHPYDVDPEVGQQTLKLAKALQDHAIRQMARGICPDCKGNGSVPSPDGCTTCRGCDGDGWHLPSVPKIVD